MVSVAKASVPEETDIDLGSDKLYFKIGEVAEIVGVPAYVLRYWESEFKAVKPQKSRTQQRVYRRRDVGTLLKIKHLLYDKKFTIAGARQQLKEAPQSVEPAPVSGVYLARQSLARARRLLDEARSLCDGEDVDRTAADPAGWLASAGGARAVLAAGGRSLVERPARRPR
jgi:DNA-binding transcriptional MerR regulator